MTLRNRIAGAAGLAVALAVIAVSAAVHLAAQLGAHPEIDRDGADHHNHGDGERGRARDPRAQAHGSLST